MLRQLQTIAGLLARLLHKTVDAHAIRKKNIIYLQLEW